MKKCFFLICSMLLGLAAQAGTEKELMAGDETVAFTDNIVVVYDGETYNLVGTIELVHHIDACTIDFTFPNLIIDMNGEQMPIGTITVNSIPLTPAEGYYAFTYDGEVKVTSGDTPGVGMWLGPLLGSVPVKVTGKVNFDMPKLYTVISINVALVGQAVSVTFGTDFVSEEVALGPDVVNFTDISPYKAYAIHSTGGEGFWCYNPTVNQNYVGITGVTNDGNGVVGNAEAYVAYHNKYNPNDANGQWQIVKVDGKFYVYNVGAKKFLTRVGRDYLLTDDHVAIDGIKRNGGELGFSFHAGGDMSETSKNFACIVTNTAPQAVRNWTWDDHGATMLISEIEGFNDNSVYAMLSGVDYVQTLNDAIARAQADYDSHDVAGEALVTKASQFYSPYTTPDGQCESNSEVYTYLLDGKVETYWHSVWRNVEVAIGTHYLQVKMPEPVEGDVLVRLVRRKVGGNHITKMGVNATSNGVSYTKVAEVELPYENGGETVMGRFTLPTPSSHVRLYGNEMMHGGETRGCWHAAELQLYKATEKSCNEEHPDAAAALMRAIATAKGVAGPTEKDVKNLLAAIEAYDAAIAPKTDGIGSVATVGQTGAIYNLQGQRVKAIGRGVNIVGGRKIVK